MHICFFMPLTLKKPRRLLISTMVSLKNLSLLFPRKIRLITKRHKKRGNPFQPCLMLNPLIIHFHHLKVRRHLQNWLRKFFFFSFSFSFSFFKKIKNNRPIFWLGKRKPRVRGFGRKADQQTINLRSLFKKKQTARTKLTIREKDRHPAL